MIGSQVQNLSQMKGTESGIKTSAVNPAEEKNSSIKSSSAKGSPAGEKSIYGGDLNLLDNGIEKKKKQAQSMAMELMEGVFANDLKMDEDQRKRTEHSKELKAENNEYRSKLGDIRKERERMKEEYRIEDDSVQEQELALMRKARDYPQKMTKEEQQEVSEIYARGKTKYQEDMMILDGIQKEFEDKIAKNQKKIIEENAIVRGMKIERLKSHDMVDAKDRGDQLIAAANKEIVGMLVEEGKQKIDNEAEEKMQEARERKEEKKELEEKIEAAKAERARPKEEEHEEMYELDSVLQDVKKVQTRENLPDVKKSMEQIVNELKLTAEDIKGAVVDQEV